MRREAGDRSSCERGKGTCKTYWRKLAVPGLFSQCIALRLLSLERYNMAKAERPRRVKAQEYTETEERTASWKAKEDELAVVGVGIKYCIWIHVML